MSKQKYVRLKEFDKIIIFHDLIQHSEFDGWVVISAGFCYVNNSEVKCFGESISLGLKSLEEDSEIATKQIFKEGYF
jgi:hypothetical protein